MVCADHEHILIYDFEIVIQQCKQNIHMRNFLESPIGDP